MVLDAGQGVLLGIEPLVLEGVVHGGRGELLDLVAQQVDLAGTRPGIATETGQRLVDRPDALAGLVERRQVHGGEAVEGCPLRRAREQALVGVLPVQVDQDPSELAELGHGGEAPVHVGPRPTLSGDHAAQDQLVLAVHEAPLDDGLGRAGPHQRRLGPPAHQQLDGLDEERLAGARLAGQRAQPRPEEQAGPADHPEVLDDQLGQHQRSERPNLAFRIWWKRRGPKRTKRAGSSAARKWTVLPWARVVAR